MRLHVGKAFNSLKLTDYLEEEEAEASIKITHQMCNINHSNTQYSL